MTYKNQHLKVSSSTHRFVAFFAGTLQKDQTRWSYFENYCVAGVFGGRLFVEWLVIELRVQITVPIHSGHNVHATEMITEAKQKGGSTRETTVTISRIKTIYSLHINSRLRFYFITS